MTRTWLITGASRGFGASFARAAAARGDRVAATARDPRDLDALRADHPDVLPLTFDARDPESAPLVVEAAAEEFGGLDIVVNNAGYGLFGMVEEISDELILDQLQVNFLAPLRVVRAALPHLRAQGFGHIVQISSVGGVGAFPDLGIYNASKWALEAASESLAREIAGFGVHVTIVEPGVYATDWAGPSSDRPPQLSAYAEFRAANPRLPRDAGDPDAAAAALLEVVDSEQPPLRVVFGNAALGLARSIYADRLAGWDATQAITERSDQR